MYDRLLVPLDGSSVAETALGFVEHLPSHNLRLLRVDPDDPMLIPPSVTGVEPGWSDRYGKQLRDELETVAERIRGEGRSVEVELRFGDAAEEIIASAEDCDLVVMATRGRGAAGRLIFGSTADRVVRHGATPTLLIRAGAHPVEPVPPRRVVVPLDGSPLAEQALPEATKLAKVLGGPIHLVRAVGFDEVLATVGRERGVHASGTQQDETDDAYEQARLETERQATDYLATQAGRLRDVDITTELLRGTPAFALLWMIEPEDVVVMTTHGRGGYRRWMIGSVAEKLVREAAAPVLLVRDKADSAPRQPVDSPSSA